MNKFHDVNDSEIKMSTVVKGKSALPFLRKSLLYRPLNSREVKICRKKIYIFVLPALYLIVKLPKNTNILKYKE
jgi:hypothetical protein